MKNGIRGEAVGRTFEGGVTGTKGKPSPTMEYARRQDAALQDGVAGMPHAAACVKGVGLLENYGTTHQNANNGKKAFAQESLVHLHLKKMKILIGVDQGGRNHPMLTKNQIGAEDGREIGGDREDGKNRETSIHTSVADELWETMHCIVPPWTVPPGKIERTLCSSRKLRKNASNWCLLQSKHWSEEKVQRPKAQSSKHK